MIWGVRTIREGVIIEGGALTEVVWYLSHCTVKKCFNNSEVERSLINAERKPYLQSLVKS